ncbi:MAG: Bax inhibitor-1/YccA family protein, partial [Ilumatobacteraceae bacterium]
NITSTKPTWKEKKREKALAAGPTPPPPSPAGQVWPAPGAPRDRVDDGPVTPWRSGVMTVNGTITATAVLFTLLLVSATAGWLATGASEEGEPIQFPSLAMIGVVVGFVAVIALYFKPQWAKILGPIYAIAQGFFVGAISAVFNGQWDGIVVQAAGATLAVFTVMLVLYRTRIIKVTDRFRKIVIGATLGVMLLYLVSFVINLFGSEVGFINSPSALGIAFSVFVCGLAAFNLALDFDFIERGAREGLSKDYEWFAAVGLLVTVVWLYLEILRLLAKLREN